MPRPLLPPRGIYVPTMMVYNREIPPSVVHTWIQLRGLAWGREETPQLSMLELSDLIGKSRSTIYGHMVLLRSWGALRWRSSEKGTFIVTFPSGTGEFFLKDDSLPAQISKRFSGNSSHAESRNPESRNLESRNLDKLDPSLSSSINYLNNDSEKEAKREIDSVDLSEGESLDSGGGEVHVSRFLDQAPETSSESPITITDDNISVDPVKIYQSVTRIRPNQTQREQITNQVQDFSLWQESIEHWLAHGWNPKNIAGLLDHYQRGGSKTCRFCSRQVPESSDALSTLRRMRDEFKETKNGST